VRWGRRCGQKQQGCQPSGRTARRAGLEVVRRDGETLEQRDRSGEAGLRGRLHANRMPAGTPEVSGGGGGVGQGGSADDAWRGGSGFAEGKGLGVVRGTFPLERAICDDSEHHTANPMTWARTSPAAHIAEKVVRARAPWNQCSVEGGTPRVGDSTSAFGDDLFRLLPAEGSMATAAHAE